jgi:hypothetical protein
MQQSGEVKNINRAEGKGSQIENNLKNARITESGGHHGSKHHI